MDTTTDHFTPLALRVRGNWASEASPTLGCAIEISRDIIIGECGSTLCRIVTYGSEPNTKVYGIRPHLFKHFFFFFFSNINSGCSGLVTILKPQ